MLTKRYSDKELRLFIWVVVPYAVAMNVILFEACFFSGTRNVFLLLGLSVACLFVAYLVFGIAAALIQRRFPASHHLFRRISIMLPVFYVLNIFLVAGLYAFYRNLDIALCEPLSRNFWWAFAFGCIASTVITFLNEAVANWPKWKKAITETERLKNAYQKSKLYGLKGQINPHFLFNCFNTLSGLIPENRQTAEQFLNELSKVYRYLLSANKDDLTPLQQEIQFIRSFLLLIENAVKHNIVSRAQPLTINLYTTSDGMLVVSNNFQPKKRREPSTGIGLRNIRAKYALLKDDRFSPGLRDGHFVVQLPLISPSS